MRDGDEFYLDVKQKSRDAEIKSESDLICSNLESSGSYKCIKCCKVNTISHLYCFEGLLSDFTDMLQVLVMFY